MHAQVYTGGVCQAWKEGPVARVGCLREGGTKLGPWGPQEFGKSVQFVMMSLVNKMLPGPVRQSRAVVRSLVSGIPPCTWEPRTVGAGGWGKCSCSVFPSRLGLQLGAGFVLLRSVFLLGGEYFLTSHFEWAGIQKPCMELI